MATIVEYKKVPKNPDRNPFTVFRTAGGEAKTVAIVNASEVQTILVRWEGGVAESQSPTEVQIKSNMTHVEVNASPDIDLPVVVVVSEDVISFSE